MGTVAGFLAPCAHISIPIYPLLDKLIFPVGNLMIINMQTFSKTQKYGLNMHHV